MSPDREELKTLFKKVERTANDYVVDEMPRNFSYPYMDIWETAQRLAETRERWRYPPLFDTDVPKIKEYLSFVIDNMENKKEALAKYAKAYELYCGHELFSLQRYKFR